MTMNRCGAMTRRRLLSVALVGGLASACVAGTAPAPGAFTLSRERLQDLLARRFPVQRSLAGLADLRLQSPQLLLLPQANRLGTVLDMVLVEHLGGRHWTGVIELDCGLRFDPAPGAIRMNDVRVRRFEVAPLAPADRADLAQLAPPLAERLLEGAELYRVPADQLALAHSLGLTVGALTVLPDGLRVALVPQPLS